MDELYRQNEKIVYYFLYKKCGDRQLADRHMNPSAVLMAAAKYRSGCARLQSTYYTATGKSTGMKYRWKHACRNPQAMPARQDRSRMQPGTRLLSALN